MQPLKPIRSDTTQQAPPIKKGSSAGGSPIRKISPQPASPAIKTTEKTAAHAPTPSSQQTPSPSGFWKSHRVQIKFIYYPLLLRIFSAINVFFRIISPNYIYNCMKSDVQKNPEHFSIYFNEYKFAKEQLAELVAIIPEEKSEPLASCFQNPSAYELMQEDHWNKLVELAAIVAETKPAFLDACIQRLSPTQFFHLSEKIVKKCQTRNNFAPLTAYLNNLLPNKLFDLTMACAKPNNNELLTLYTHWLNNEKRDELKKSIEEIKENADTVNNALQPKTSPSSPPKKAKVTFTDNKKQK